MDIDNTVVTEVCSPKRAARIPKDYNLKAGESVDLMTVLDSTQENDRRKA